MRMIKPREVTDSFRLDRVLKSGRSGIVFKASSIASGGPAAIKLIAPGCPAELHICQEQFLEAMEALQAVAPGSFPALLDYGFTPDNSAFMVMELLDIEPLDSSSSLSPQQCLSLLAEAADGLEALAVKGIAHGNLTPGNLFRRRDKGGERVAVLGFGTAAFRVFMGELTSALLASESIDFAAPELTDTKGSMPRADTRSDLYSLARVTCHLLKAQIDERPGVAPRVYLPAEAAAFLLRPDLLRDFLVQALDPRPEARPDSWASFRSAVHQALGEEPAGMAGTQPLVAAGASAPEPADQEPPSLELGEPAAVFEPAVTRVEEDVPVGGTMALSLRELGVAVAAPPPAAAPPRPAGPPAPPAPPAPPPPARPVPAAPAPFAAESTLAVPVHRLMELPGQTAEDAARPAPGPAAPPAVPAGERPLSPPPRPLEPVSSAAGRVAPPERPSFQEGPPALYDTAKGKALQEAVSAAVQVAPGELPVAGQPAPALAVAPAPVAEPEPGPEVASPVGAEDVMAALPEGAREPFWESVAAGSGGREAEPVEAVAAPPPPELPVPVVPPAPPELPVAAVPQPVPPVPVETHAIAAVPPVEATFEAHVEPPPEAAPPRQMAFPPPQGELTPAPVPGPAFVAAGFPGAVAPPAPAVAEPLSPSVPVAAPAAPPPPALSEPVLEPVLAEVAAPEVAPVAPAPPKAAAKAAPRKRGMWPLWLLLAVVVLGGAGVAFLWYQSRLAEEAVRNRPTPTPIPATPTVIPKPAEPSKVLEAVNAAASAVAASDLKAAQDALETITPADEASLAELDRTRLANVRSAYAELRLKALGTELTRNLAAGNLKALGRLLGSLSRDEEATLRHDPDKSQALDESRRALNIQKLMLAADKAGNTTEALQQALTLLTVVPTNTQATEVRDRSAAAVEGQAQAMADRGEFDQALERLETLGRIWPTRPGLPARVERVKAERDADRKVVALLTAAEQTERDKTPEKGLQMLADGRFSPRWEARGRELKERLTAQLAQLDVGPPKIEVAKGTKVDMQKDRTGVLEFEKDKMGLIPLVVTDDHAVKSVKCMARPQGGSSFIELKVTKGTGNAYTVEVAAGFHKNDAVQFYILASDYSDHVTSLGSPDKPWVIKKKKFLGIF